MADVTKTYYDSGRVKTKTHFDDGTAILFERFDDTGRQTLTRAKQDDGTWKTTYEAEARSVTPTDPTPGFEEITEVKISDPEGTTHTIEKYEEGKGVGSITKPTGELRERSKITPTGPTIVGETQSGARRTFITPSRITTEFFEKGKLVAIGKGTGEQELTYVKRRYKVKPKKDTSPFGVIESAKIAAQEGVLTTQYGAKLDLTSREQLLLGQTLILQKDVKYAPFTEKGLKIGLSIEKTGRDIGTYLTSELPDTETGRLTGRAMKSFISTPFSFAGAVFKAPAGVSTLIQSPEGSAMAVAFVATRSGRAIKEDPIGFGADIVGSWASVKVFESVYGKFSQFRAKKVSTKIDSPLGSQKPYILREGGLELDITGRFKPAPSVKFKPKNLPDEFLGIVDDIEVWKQGKVLTLQGPTKQIPAADLAFKVSHVFDDSTLTYKSVFTPNLRGKPNVFDIGLPSRTTSVTPTALKSVFDFKPLPQANIAAFASSNKLMLAPLQTKMQLATLQVTKQMKTTQFLTGASVLMQQEQITTQRTKLKSKQKQDLFMFQTQKIKSTFKPSFMQTTKLKFKMDQKQKKKNIFSFFPISDQLTSFDMVSAQKFKTPQGFKFSVPTLKSSTKTTRKRFNFDVPQFNFKPAKQFGKLKTKYRPSLAAFAYKVKGKKPKRLFGLEVRPL